MEKSLIWKVVLIIAVVAVSVLMVIPPGERKPGEKLMKINLGLDLKGGMHLVYEVMTDDAVRKQTDTNVLQLKNALKESSITFSSVARQGIDKIEIAGLQYDQKQMLKDILDDEYADREQTFAADRVVLSLKDSVVRQLKEQTVEQALETISNRINEFGVAEPVLQREQENRLLIELPGVSDKEKSRVLDLINSTAVLEFKKVISGPFESEEAALKEYNGVLPEDLMLLKRNPKSTVKGFSVVKAEAVVTGRELKNARRSRDEFGAPMVNFTLNNKGAKQMQKFSAANIGQKLAIVLDNRLYSDPVIEGVLSYDSRISGGFTIEEADDLSLVLRSGSLPAKLNLLHEQVIGPSLGADSIRKGFYANLIGLILVMIFMVLYYKMAGVNSIIAVLLNLVILMGVLSYFGATLTLPGIAGILLTIGMAVDANVLVFERIKEDLKAGKAPKAAIDSGFKKAFVTIFDANLTTIIAAVFLFQFGTSAIKGFSVTLMIGIVASMFTAIFVSRVLFELIYGRKKKLTSISI